MNGGNNMGMVQAEITLINSWDEGKERSGIIGASEIRKVTITAVVDTGAATLVINEEIRKKLGLEIKSHRIVTLADGSKKDYSMTEPVTVMWKNRDTVCSAYVLPNSPCVFLGAIPLEGLDLTINPKRQELIGAHGEEQTGYVFYCGGNFVAQCGGNFVAKCAGNFVAR